MQYALGYIKYFFLSHSRHGTHSPFVYRLVDEVIYKKSDRSEFAYLPPHFGRRERKKFLLLVRILRNFIYDDFEIVSDVPDKNLSWLFAEHRGAGISRRIIYYDTAKCIDWHFYRANHNDIFIINEPHLDFHRDSNWKSLQNDKRVVVTVDLYCIGLVFFRKEQRKENFLIRF